MNILLSSYSVNPYHGSEDGIGWNWTVLLSRNFPDSKIYLVTKTCNEADTRKGLDEYGLDNVELIIVDPPYWLNWYREHNSAFHHAYYILWQALAYRWAKNSGIKFDIVHHVTMGDFRITGKMYKFKNAYTIFGPVGGGQSTPKALKCYEKSPLFERTREIISRTRAYSPSYKRRIRGFDKVYAVNNETAEIMSKALGRGCEQLFEIALAEEFKNLEINKKTDGTVRLLYVGRLINKKGLGLMLDVINRVNKGLDFVLEIYGDGPMRQELENYIKQNGLEEKVKLFGAVEHTQISRAYINGDIFIMPSLRETGGTVLIEAMAHKLPVCSLDMSVSRILKEHNCGIFINIEQGREEIISDFATAIERLIKDSDLREKLGQSGYDYTNSQLCWENKFNIIYKDFINDSVNR